MTYKIAVAYTLSSKKDFLFETQSRVLFKIVHFFVKQYYKNDRFVFHSISKR